MPAILRYLFIKSLLLGLVWQIHCFPTLPPGKIICGRIGADVEDTLDLTTAEVKAQAIETYSGSDVRLFLEGNPKFYKYKSTVFTNLDHKKAMEDDYTLMKNQLQSIKDRFPSSPPEFMSETDFDKLSHTIEQLGAFQQLIQKEMQDRIFKMEGQGSHIEAIEINGIGEDDSLNKKEITASPSSETSMPKELGLDLAEQIVCKVWDGQLDKLSIILHEIPFLRDDYHKIKTQGNELSLELQNLLFQQVGYMYKQKMISREGFKKFCQSKITLEIAALTMIHTIESSKLLRHLSPVTILNEWTSENYRNIYEVLDERNKRYFSYILLKAFDYNTFNWNEDFHPESLFKEDKLFQKLEDLVSPTSTNPYLSATLEELRIQDPSYEQIEASVKGLISMFENNQDYSFTNIYRKRSFFILDFIKTHYGLDIFQPEKDEEFEEKMKLMSSSFGILGELNNIYWYLNEGELSGKNISAIKKYEDGNEVLIIYKLLRYLISKHQSLFFESEMTNYQRTYSLNSIVKKIDAFITKVIDKHNYYFHLDS